MHRTISTCSQLWANRDTICAHFGNARFRLVSFHRFSVFILNERHAANYHIKSTLHEHDNFLFLQSERAFYRNKIRVFNRNWRLQNALIIALHICLLYARFGRPPSTTAAAELLHQHRRSSRAAAAVAAAAAISSKTHGGGKSGRAPLSKRRSTVTITGGGKQSRHSIQSGNSEEGASGGELTVPHASTRRPSMSTAARGVAGAAASRAAPTTPDVASTGAATTTGDGAIAIVPLLERQSPPLKATERTRQSFDDFID